MLMLCSAFVAVLRIAYPTTRPTSPTPSLPHSSVPYRIKFLFQAANGSVALIVVVAVAVALVYIRNCSWEVSGATVTKGWGLGSWG